MLISGFNYVPEQNYDILVNVDAVTAKSRAPGCPKCGLCCFRLCPRLFDVDESLFRSGRGLSVLRKRDVQHTVLHAGTDFLFLDVVREKQGLLA